MTDYFIAIDREKRHYFLHWKMRKWFIQGKEQDYEVYSLLQQGQPYKKENLHSGNPRDLIDLELKVMNTHGKTFQTAPLVDIFEVEDPFKMVQSREKNHDFALANYSLQAPHVGYFEINIQPNLLRHNHVYLVQARQRMNEIHWEILGAGGYGSLRIFSLDNRGTIDIAEIREFIGREIFFGSDKHDLYLLSPITYATELADPFG